MDAEKKREVPVFCDQFDKNEKDPRLSDSAVSSAKRKSFFRAKRKLLFRAKRKSFDELLKCIWPLSYKPLSTESNKLCLFFWHAYSPVMYSLYEVPIPLLHPPSKDDKEVPIPLLHPPSKDDKRMNLKSLDPIIQLKTGKYPDGMCCVQLGSVLYFLGGEMNFDNPFIDEDVKKELDKNVKRDAFPQDVYYFDLNLASNFSKDEDLQLPVATKSMNSGKANPLAFVADMKIYVIGSNHQGSDENFAYFEMFDPVKDEWSVLPNPPIRNVNWVAHVVVGRKALIVAWQGEKERLYFFDLRTNKWSNTYIVIPDYLGNFSGNTEFVGNIIYGCYYDTVAAIVPIGQLEELKELEERVAGIVPSEEEEDEKEEESEENDLQQLFMHHRLHQVSEEMGMDAILDVPPQVQYSSSLLHLGNRYFCYVRTGMDPHPDPDLASDLVIGDDKKRFISIVIFEAGHETYKKDDTRFFKANFIRSEHYEVNTSFPNEGFIKGCYVFGSDLTMLDLSLSTHKTWDDGGKHMICATGIPRVELTDQRLRWGGLGQKMSKRVSIAKVPLNPPMLLAFPC